MVQAHKELLPLTQPSATATAAGVVASAPPPPNGRSTKGLMELMEEEQLSDFIPGPQLLLLLSKDGIAPVKWAGGSAGFSNRRTEGLLSVHTGLGMFLFRRDKHSRKRRAEFLQLGRSQKAKIVKLTYEIIENVCAKVCPGGQGDLLDSIARIHKTYRRRRLSNMALQQGLSASSPSSASSQGLLSAIDEELGGGGGPGVDASTAMGAEHLMHGMHMGGGGGSLGLPRHPGMGEGVTSTMRTAAGLMDLARRNQLPMNHLGGMGAYAATPANPAVRAAFGQPSNNYYDNVAAKGAAFSQRSGLGSSVLPGGFPVDAMSGTHHHLPQQQQAAHEPTPAYRHPFETEFGAQDAWVSSDKRMMVRHC